MNIDIAALESYLAQHPLRQYFLPKQITADTIRDLLRLGMVARDELFDGLWCLGFARNSRLSIYTSGKFHYLRTKGDEVRMECLYHPQDFPQDYVGDLFVPILALPRSLNPNLPRAK